MRFFYFIHLAEHAFLQKLPAILNELVESGDMPGLIRKYHINGIAGKRYASKQLVMDPIFIEVIGFLKHLHETKWYSYRELSDKVTFVTRDHAFIYGSDDTIHHLAPGKKIFEKIFPSTESIEFMSMRDSFYQPFFLFIEGIMAHNSGISFKTLVNESASLSESWPYKDKLHTLSRVHSDFPEYTGKFVVPLYRGNDPVVIEKILWFAKDSIGNNVILKKSFGCAGESIRPLDLKKKINPDTLTNVARDYFFNGGDFSGTIIMPLYHIRSEYRIYYTYQDNDPKVYSIKSRENKISYRNMLEQTSLKIYKNIPVKWKYIGKDFTEGDRIRLKDIIDGLIKKIWYNTGILEIIETDTNDIVVMEVNYLGCSLVFPGEDVDNMTRYNTNIHNYLFS